MANLDLYEIYKGYQHMGLYLIIIILLIAILTFYLLHLYTTGDASMFNVTNSSWNCMRNNSSCLIIDPPVRWNFT